MTTRANLRAVLRGKNVYVEGIGFLGRVGDIELPKVEFEMAEDGNMSRKVDTGLLKPMEAKITIYDLNTVLFDAIGARLKNLASFVIKASIVDGGEERAVYVELSGQVASQEFDNMKEAGKESGIALEIGVVRYRLEIGGKPKYNIDADAMICEINGKDHYSTLRKQL